MNPDQLSFGYVNGAFLAGIVVIIMGLVVVFSQKARR